jgi:lipopolysaccharide assembly outer membrane protein LptD (OstA)
MKYTGVFIKSLFILSCFLHVVGLFALQTQTDTLAENQSAQSDLDAPVPYQAQTITNYVQKRKTVYIGKAVVHYKNITLEAGKITIEWDKSLITAEGIPDSIWVYNQAHTDSIRVQEIREKPVLVDGGTRMTGDLMQYNYKTEKGRVVRGRTEVEGGYYVGDQIKRVRGEIFHITDSEYTTCDLDTNTHYHFSTNRMKLMVNDKVIAKPVVMYIGHIPVAFLPYAVFPTKRGRHSGILIPRYGESSREGRYFRGLGYYWAPNDYFDAKAEVDFFEKSGWLFHGDINYAIRYKLSGSISASITRKNFESYYAPDYEERRWDLRVNHRQEIDQTSRFTASGYFVSDNSFYKDLSTNLSMRLTQELRSNATYSKRWPKQKLSLSLNASRVQNLQTEDIRETLPQLSFRMAQRQLFAAKTSRGRQRRRTRDEKWYRSIYFSYNSNLQRTRREYWQRTSADTSRRREDDFRVSHNTSLSFISPTKLFGWLSHNHSVNIDEDWFAETTEYDRDQESGTIESRQVKGFAARHLFSYNAAANTKLYGLFTPPIPGVEAVRHVLTPSISFRYQPDFSDPVWGYYSTFDEGETKKDRFGGTPSGGQKSVNFSVRNLFQMKLGQGEKIKKVDLFTMDFSSGYNFEADQYNLSDLRTSIRANPARNFSLSASSSHSFYRWDDELSGQVDEYIFKQGNWMTGKWMRLRNLRLNFSLRLQGKESKRTKRPETAIETGDPFEEDMESEDAGVLEESAYQSRDRFEGSETLRHLSIPWKMNLNFNFNLNRTNPGRPVKRYYLDISGAEVQLTPNWRISYSAHYDLEKMVVSHHRFSFYRDLHCWEAQVDWVPVGPNRRVYFRINIKAPALRDIKYERGRGAGNMLGYY